MARSCAAVVYDRDCQPGDTLSHSISPRADHTARTGHASPHAPPVTARSHPAYRGSAHSEMAARAKISKIAARIPTHIPGPHRQPQALLRRTVQHRWPHLQRLENQTTHALRHHQRRFPAHHPIAHPRRRRRPTPRLQVACSRCLLTRAVVAARATSTNVVGLRQAMRGTICVPMKRTPQYVRLWHAREQCLSFRN